jgi:hypothetical protein
MSLALIEELRLNRDAAIVDQGAGASSLAARLLAQGFIDITVLDVSARALELARADLGANAARVCWLEQDLLSWSPPTPFSRSRGSRLSARPADPATRHAHFRDRRDEVGDAGEHAAADGLVGQLAKEPLDEIQPRAGGRREVQVKARVLGQPLRDVRVLVGGVVVDRVTNARNPVRFMPMPAARVTRAATSCGVGASGVSGNVCRRSRASERRARYPRA